MNTKGLDSQDIAVLAMAIDGVANSIMNMPEHTFSLRDEIAMKVIQGITSREDYENIDPQFIADFAYAVADACIKKRGVKR